MPHKALLSALLAMLCLAAGTQSATATKLTLKNNCPYPIWPVIVEELDSSSLSPTAFELPQGATKTLDVPAKGALGVWARTHCAKDSHGKFKCVTGDCGTGVAECKGIKAVPETTTLVLLDLNHGGNDSYYVDLSTGFNVPVSVVPSGGSRAHCRSTACPVDLNAHCPNELAVVVDSRIVACKSACSALNTPETCCIEEYSGPNECPPTKYDHYFLEKCPQATARTPFDDKSKVEECKDGESYAITFCP